jgi:hypothetical protein
VQKDPAGQSCAGIGLPSSWHVYPGLHLIGSVIPEKKQKVPEGHKSQVVD